ncbi:major tail protein [Carnobacterium sp. FSL E2-0243]|jgi:phi13 family phage major tail protein|uniref:major tail protein n=1 Tax=Carnobacterium sp. FSL E2-0243 TaxID=2921365 RepID=UPI0030F52152
MAKIGVKDLFAFPITKEEDGVLPTYGEGFRIAKAIQVTLTPQNAEGNLYADDGQDEFESSTIGYDISMNTNDLLPDSESKLLGRKIDSLGGVSVTNDDEAPYHAVGFRVARSKGVGGGYQYRILYKVRFSAFAEDYQTKGESVNFQTPTLTGKSISRDYDGLFNYKLDDDGSKPAVKAVTDTWFDEVVEPAAPVTP